MIGQAGQLDRLNPPELCIASPVRPALDLDCATTRAFPGVACLFFCMASEFRSSYQELAATLERAWFAKKMPPNLMTGLVLWGVEL